MSRELEAWRVAETEADPILVSRARVAPTAAARLGYVAVAECRHCTDGLLIVEVGKPWTHRKTGIVSCRYDAVRTGCQATHVKGAAGSIIG